GGGSYAIADRPGVGPWETWTVHFYDDGTISLQAHNGMYLTAQDDGTVAVKAVESGEWERFEYEVRDDTTVAFKNPYFGSYLQAPLGGGANQKITQASDDPNLPGEWEFFESSEKFWTAGTADNPNLLHGVMTREDRVRGDDSGPRIIMACHFMEGFSAYCHNKTIGALDVRTQLEIIAEKYGAVRNLDVLGYWDANRPGDADEWEAWKGREVTPIGFIANSERYIEPTPDYWGKKREYVTLLHELGLKILDDRGDMNSWTREQKLNHMFQNGQFYNSLPFGKEVLLGGWSINEAWQNGGDDKYLLKDMLTSFKEGAGWLPAICGLSAPGGTSDPEALAKTDPLMTSWESEMPDSFIYWSDDPATVLTVHGNRGALEHIVE